MKSPCFLIDLMSRRTHSMGGRTTFALLLCSLLLWCEVCISADIRIDFTDGTNHKRIGSDYFTKNLIVSNMQFFDTSYRYNVPFSFSDDWGMVIIGGAAGPVGFLEFPLPVDWVQLDGFGQAAYDIGAEEPFSWYLAAYNEFGELVDYRSENFGLDFLGGYPGEAPYYPLGKLSLRVESQGGISSVQFAADRKFGIDTVSYSEERIVVPEGRAYLSSLLLVVIGLGRYIRACFQNLNQI